jgi:hypothetical protein
MNERKIEREVYQHFANQINNIGVIEEQISENMRVKNLLRGASKSNGTGFGRPEHIISLKNFYDLLIITECKPDKKVHHSLDNIIDTKKYAVDGVKHYSKFLSKEFDVISIAISGEGLNDCKITHFFQKKGTETPIKILGDKLLDINSYLNFYNKNEKTINQD